MGSDEEQVNVVLPYLSTHIVHLYLFFTGSGNLRIGHIILNINRNMENKVYYSKKTSDSTVNCIIEQPNRHTILLTHIGVWHSRNGHVDGFIGPFMFIPIFDL